MVMSGIPDNLPFEELLAKVASVTEANANAAESGVSGPTVGIPPLPPGTTLDLTHPTIQVSNVEFKIPDHLSVASGSAVIGPGSLTTEDWIVIAKNNNFLRAYTLADPPGEQGDPPRAATLALDYMVPTSADFYEDMHLQSSVLSEVTYSSATASYVRAGFDTQSASLSIPYAAASFERQRKEREARASSKKTIYMIGRWFYPRAKLHTRKFTKASTRFTAALEDAVNKSDPAAVEQVFNTYGWAVPEEVVIGGQLFFIHKEVCDASVNETEVEQTIRAAVTAKYQGIQASAGISFGSGSSSKVTAEQVNQRTQFDARGGDTMLASNPKIWPDSVKDPNKWAVIRVSKVAPIPDWLEPALRAKVERLLPEMHAPALQMPEDVSAVDHPARANSDGFVFGMRTINQPNQKGALGGLQLVCGSSGSPGLDQGDAVGGRATFHSSHVRPDDMWIDGASICLPVPKGSHYRVIKWDDFRDEGEAATRFTKIETKLTFGKWQTLADKKGFTGAGQPAAFAPGGRDSDGFIFCSVRAPRANQDRGVVSCTVDGKILGAASVHNNTRGGSAGSSGPDACFCVPVPRHLSMSIDATARAGMLDIKVWYLASTSPGWTFGKPEPYSLNSYYTAETDGFLNGVVTVREGNARGMLYLFCGPDTNNVSPRYSLPPAMMAVHQTSNRFIPYASAMLPIRRGFVFYSAPQLLSADRGHKGATVEAYWTPLLPVA
jgi:hypothetical protein